MNLCKDTRGGGGVSATGTVWFGSFLSFDVTIFKKATEMLRRGQKRPRKRREGSRSPSES